MRPSGQRQENTFEVSQWINRRWSKGCGKVPSFFSQSKVRPVMKRNISYMYNCTMITYTGYNSSLVWATSPSVFMKNVPKITSMFQAVHFVTPSMISCGDDSAISHWAPAVLWVKTLQSGEVSIWIAIGFEAFFGLSPKLTLSVFFCDEKYSICIIQ